MEEREQKGGNILNEHTEVIGKGISTITQGELLIRPEGLVKAKEKNVPQLQDFSNYTLKLLSLLDSKYWLYSHFDSSWHQKVMYSKY